MGSSRPGLSLFSAFSGMCTHHFYTGQKITWRVSPSFNAFCPGWRGGLRPPSPALPWDLPANTVSHSGSIRVSGLLPPQTGSCFLVHSSKQNPVPPAPRSSGSLPPPPSSPSSPRGRAASPHPLLVASWPRAALAPGAGSSGLVHWPLFILTYQWCLLMPTPACLLAQDLLESNFQQPPPPSCPWQECHLVPSPQGPSTSCS